MYKNLSTIITCKVPTRFDFGGGPSDVQPFPHYFDGFVVNVAINLYAKVKLEIIDGSREIMINSKDFGMIEKFDSIDTMDLLGSTSLLKAAIKYVNPQYGFKLTTEVEVPPGSGLGSSGALTIAVLRALTYIVDGKYYNFEKIVRDSMYIENKILNNICGGQDQYASALGGFNSFLFKGNDVQLNSIKISKEKVEELERNSLLCFSGSTHISGNILNQVVDKFTSGDMQVKNALISIRDIAIDLVSVLENGQFEKFGCLLNDIFNNQKKLHHGMTNEKIDKLFSIGFKNGVIGGKIAGAGGGGFVFLYCKKGKRIKVKKALSDAGYVTHNVKFDFNGPVVKIV